MPAITKQPQIQSKNFVAQYSHEGLRLDVFGQFDGEGNFSLEAIGIAGTTIDVSALMSEQLDQIVIGWAEFMAPTWQRESAEQQAIDDYTWAHEYAMG